MQKALVFWLLPVGELWLLLALCCFDWRQLDDEFALINVSFCVISSLSTDSLASSFFLMSSLYLARILLSAILLLFIMPTRVRSSRRRIDDIGAILVSRLALADDNVWMRAATIR